jgi:hypothetical protein
MTARRSYETPLAELSDEALLKELTGWVNELNRRLQLPRSGAPARNNTELEMSIAELIEERTRRTMAERDR